VPSNTERDPPHAPAGLLHAKPWQVAMIGLGTTATQLDTAVNIAFPAITRGFGLAIGDIQWVVICYVLTYASLLLALGRIGDTVGHALVFRIGLIWSAVALLLVSWSPSYGAMLVFRCLQGVGAALVLSCGAALVTSLYGEERRSRALGIYTMMVSFGLMLGPLLGGALTAVWDWPAVFLFRIPIAIAALLLLRAMPVSPARPASDRFDILGGIALTLGLVTMLLALNRLREFSAVWFGLLSAVAFAAFIFRESRAARPIIAVGILGRPGFALLNLVSVLAIFGLAVGTVCSGARPRLYADREWRHPGCSRGRGCGGRADRRSPGRAVHFRRAAGDSGCRRYWRRSSAARRVDGANPDNAADHGALRAGSRPRPVPACLFGYRDRSASAHGPRRCRQPRSTDANVGHRDRSFGRPDGV
jgi:MFS family permease